MCSSSCTRFSSSRIDRSRSLRLLFAHLTIFGRFRLGHLLRVLLRLIFRRAFHFTGRFLVGRGGWRRRGWASRSGRPRCPRLHRETGRALHFLRRVKAKGWLHSRPAKERPGPVRRERDWDSRPGATAGRRGRLAAAVRPETARASAFVPAFAARPFLCSDLSAPAIDPDSLAASCRRRCRIGPAAVSCPCPAGPASSDLSCPAGWGKEKALGVGCSCCFFSSSIFFFTYS